MQHAGSLAVACELLVVACGIQFSDQRLSSGPPLWELGVLATGLPVHIPSDFLKNHCIYNIPFQVSQNHNLVTSLETHRLGWHRSSLVAWWLGFWVFTAVAWVHSLVKELSPCKPCGAARKNKVKMKKLKGLAGTGNINWFNLP